MKTKLIRLSICECGFPALNEDIKLGTEYTVDPDDTECFSWRCGGCGELQSVVAIMVAPRLPGQKPGYLPMRLFDTSLETMKERES